MLEFIGLWGLKLEQICKSLMPFAYSINSAEELRFPDRLRKICTTAGLMWKKFRRTSERTEYFVNRSNLALSEQHVTCWNHT
jgi:hypothetical protein